MQSLWHFWCFKLMWLSPPHNCERYCHQAKVEVANKYGWEDVYSGKPPSSASWIDSIGIFAHNEEEIFDTIFDSMFANYLKAYFRAFLWGWIHWTPFQSPFVPYVTPFSFATSEAAQAPPDQSPAQDARPQHWVEIAKNGDAWVLCKDGILYSMTMGHTFGGEQILSIQLYATTWLCIHSHKIDSCMSPIGEQGHYTRKCLEAVGNNMCGAENLW